MVIRNLWQWLDEAKPNLPDVPAIMAELSGLPLYPMGYILADDFDLPFGEYRSYLDLLERRAACGSDWWQTWTLYLQSHDLLSTKYPQLPARKNYDLDFDMLYDVIIAKENSAWWSVVDLLLAEDFLPPHNMGYFRQLLDELTGNQLCCPTCGQWQFVSDEDQNCLRGVVGVCEVCGQAFYFDYEHWAAQQEVTLINFWNAMPDELDKSLTAKLPAHAYAEELIFPSQSQLD